MDVVQVLKSTGSSTFGELSSKYFKPITTSLANCKEVHIVFDQYWDVSIIGIRLSWETMEFAHVDVSPW